MSTVAIIIVNYNSWRDTIECLESLKKITYKFFNVIIVDNNSPDASVQKIKTFLKESQSLQATTYKLQANFGFAGGNNIAIKHALEKGADYVLLLNPDAIVEKNFLTELINAAQEYKSRGQEALFGPRIYLYPKPSTLNPKYIYSNGGIVNWSQTKGTLKDYGKLASDVREKKPFETGYVSGTCILVSREIIEQIGLMEEDYFLYYEDTDWAIRGQKQGIASVIVPQSIIWHKTSTSTKEGSPLYIYYHVRNGLYCGWRNGNMLQKIAVLGLSLWTFAKQPFKLFIPSRRHWAMPVMRGVIDFWEGKTGSLTSKII